MEGYILHEELAPELWRATFNEGGKRAIIKFPKDTSLSALSTCRREYDVGCKVRDVEGVVAPKQILEGNDLVGLLLEDCGGDLLSKSINEFRICPPTNQFIQDFLTLATSIAHTLEGIHSKDIVLCSLQPDSILLGSNGVFLFEFSHAATIPINTSIEVADCDLRYISPEATGRTQHNMDCRSDLYSLGAILFHLITGRVPFSFDTAAALVYAHIAKKAAHVSDLVPGVPTVISRIIAKLLTKSPTERYQSAYGLKWDLEQCQRLLCDLEIPVFPLGTRDKMRKFILPTTLFGREDEITVLKNVFTSVANGSSALVFVSGHSGVGKTSLIQTAQQRLEYPRFFYVSGKFDQVNKFVPYSAFIQAAADLMRQVLARSKEMVEAYKQKLNEALGANAQVVIELVPLLALIIGPHSPAPDLPPIESQNRFNAMFHDFFQVFAREDAPLLLFLDDLQWADASTLVLLQLFGAKASKHIVVIAAYRDNEVSPESGPGKVIEVCKSTITSVVHIHLGPLNLNTLDSLVSSTFPSTNTMALSKVILKKTEGNPFFVRQFLKTIHHEGLLRFDPTSEVWYWDLQEIHSLCSTTNVVEFMVQTLSKFDADTQKVLKFAGCLGNYFNLDVLAIATAQAPQKTMEDLAKALKGEYVIRLDNTNFKFVHDRVQQAAFSLIPEDMRPKKQLLIGRRLLHGLPKATIDYHLFDVVSLLNLGAALVAEDGEKLEIARLNFAAGVRAKNSAAYGSALVYLQSAYNLLNEDPWAADYEFTFKLNEVLCECEFLSGSMERAEKLAQDTVKNSLTRKDKCAIYKILVQQYAILGKYREAVEAGFTCLDMYGIQNNRKPTDDDASKLYGEVKDSLMKLPAIHDLSLSPPAESVAVQESFQIVGSLIPAVFFCSIELLTEFLSRMMKVMIQEGKTPQSAMVIVWFAAFVAGSRYKDFQMGFDLGQVAISLNEQYNEPTSQMIGNFIFGDFINYWKRHLTTDVPYLQKAFKEAIDVGDLGYACYATCHLWAVNLMAGTPLKDMLTMLEPYTNFVNSTKYEEMQDMLASMALSVNALQEGGVAVFSGEFFLALEDRMLKTRSLCAQSYHFIFKMMAQCLFSDFSGALESAKHSKNALPGCVAHCFWIYHFFFHNIALAGSHHPLNNTRAELDAALEIMEANHKEIQLYSDVSEENFLPLCLLSQAGMHKLKDNLMDALDLLESAIESASTGGFIHIKAFANECFTRLLMSKGKKKAVVIYADEAIGAYEQYGAYAKANAIKDVYPSLRWKKVRPESPSNSLKKIDLHTILAASHSLSEEFMLPQLLKKLMTMTMQTAGAERGYLLLPKEDDSDVLWPAAESRNQEVNIFSETDTIKLNASEAILNYVKRALAPVVLIDACEDMLWKNDPYLSSVKAKSVLCMPCIRQGKLEAILYLENNLTAGAFSPEFLNVLSMLAAQAAISIQNSRMYMHVLRAKEQAQRAIEAQIKLSESVPVIVYSLGLDGGMEYINQRWCTYTGLSLEQSLGMQWLKNVHCDDSEGLLYATRAKVDIDMECRLKKADGTYRWHLMRAEVKKEKGEITGWFGTFMDIDDRKRIEEMNRADQAKSRFLASMSHEMRTPLSGVIGMASLLCSTPLSAEQIDMVHTISMCSELLLVLINNILDIFKLEEKQVVLEKCEISPLECAEKSMDIITVGANDKRIDVVVDFDEDVPAIVIGDSHRLEQIFINLLANAVKFTPEGGEIVVRGSIDTSPKKAGEENAHRLIFAVQDNGVGVPPEGESKLFQLFSQCDTSTTRLYGGTGLGLAISKRLVEMMGGRIWYENRGKGATFVFSIAAPRADAKLPPSPPPPKLDAVHVIGRQCTLRDAIAEKIRRLGPRVTISGQFEPDLVSSNFCTIVVDGEDVDWAAQQKASPKAHVLVLSRTIPSSEKLPTGLHFMRKPVKLRRILQYLNKISSTEQEQMKTIASSLELKVPHQPLPLRILLADDNEMNQKVALKLLQSIGYAGVKVAGNGLEALQMLEKNQFDVILMDMEMPIMDGCQATSAIRSNPPKNPIHIISMTANAFPEDWARCVTAGMCTYLPKPVKRDTLAAELHKAALVKEGKQFCSQCSSQCKSPDTVTNTEDNVGD